MVDSIAIFTLTSLTGYGYRTAKRNEWDNNIECTVYVKG